LVERLTEKSSSLIRDSIPGQVCLTIEKSSLPFWKRLSHTKEVLEELGYSPVQIEEMIRNKVIVSR